MNTKEIVQWILRFIDAVCIIGGIIAVSYVINPDLGETEYIRKVIEVFPVVPAIILAFILSYMFKKMDNSLSFGVSMGNLFLSYFFIHGFAHETIAISEFWELEDKIQPLLVISKILLENGFVFGVFWINLFLYRSIFTDFKTRLIGSITILLLFSLGIIIAEKGGNFDSIKFLGPVQSETIVGFDLGNPSESGFCAKLWNERSEFDIAIAKDSEFTRYWGGIYGDRSWDFLQEEGISYPMAYYSGKIYILMPPGKYFLGITTGDNLEIDYPEGQRIQTTCSRTVWSDVDVIIAGFIVINRP